MAEAEHADADDWGRAYAGDASDIAPTLRRPPRRSRGLRRAALAAVAFAVSILCVGLIGGGIFFLRLAQGPIAFDLVGQIKSALNERVGHGYAFDLGGTTIEATDHGPALTITNLSVVDGASRPVLSAPHAAVSIDFLKTITKRRLALRQLEVSDVDLRLLVLADGEVAVSAGSVQVPLSRAFDGPARQTPPESGTAAPPDLPGVPVIPGALVSPATPTNGALRALTASLQSLVDATTSPTAALGRFEGVHVTGRLTLDDRTHGTTTQFNRAELSFAKSEDGGADLSVAAEGPTGRWTIAAHASRNGDGSKTLTLDMADISLDEITLAGGLRNVGFDFDMPLLADVKVHISADGDIDEAAGRFGLGAGYFKLDDPDHEPLLIDSITGGFHFDPKTRGIIVDRTELKAGESDFVLKGRLDMPRSVGDPWAIHTEASGTFGTERPGEKPVKIASADMNFRLFPADHRLVVERIEIRGPEVDFSSSGDIRVDGEHLKLNNTSSVRHMPAVVMARLWPSLIAAPVRAWLLANMHGGMVESGRSVVSLDENDLAMMRIQRSAKDDHVRIDYAVSGASFNILNGLPPLAAVDGVGVITGDTSTLTVSHGEMDAAPGRKLILADGTFRVPSTDPKPTPAVVEAHVVGSMDAAADILGRDVIKPYAGVPIDPATMRGRVDSHLSIGLKLGEPNTGAESRGSGNANVTVSANATVSDFSADKLIGKEGLTDSTLQLVADRNGVRAKGEGKIYGAPASFDLRKPAGGGAGEAVLTLVLDAAARAKAGLTLKPLSGTVAVRVTAPLTEGDRDRRQASLELDFTKASLDGLVPGFSKPAGKPAKATLTLQSRDGGVALDNIVFDGGGAAVRGSAEIDSKGDLTVARLSQVKLSPGDDLKLDATQNADVLKISARGANLDARPFLKWLGATSSGTDGPDVDIDLHTGLLTGQNSQAISSADLRLSRRNGQVRSMQLTGRMGRGPITIATAKQDGSPAFVIHADDAGSSLSFLDLYKRMAGGRLDTTLSFGRGALRGTATVHDFTLREDPAIKKIATEGLAAQPQIRDSGRIDPSAVPFTKLELKFTKTGSRIAVEDGALYGPSLGATVRGNLDLVRDEVNLQGTFVPLFGINNLFSQVPLFGPILGGGKQEGLFGINYKITGSPSQPVMTINPLSAVAPGFLREIVGAFDAPQGAATPRDSAPGPGAASQGAPSEIDQ